MSEKKGRKFIAFMIATIIVSAIFVVFSFIMAGFAKDNFGTFIWGVCGLTATYITGNAAVKFSQKGGFE